MVETKSFIPRLNLYFRHPIKYIMWQSTKWQNQWITKDFIAKKNSENLTQSVGDTDFFTQILDNWVKNENNLEPKSYKDSSVINLSIACSDERLMIWCFLYSHV